MVASPTSPTRSEVWLVDLGMVAKVRLCLVLSVPADDENDRVLTTVIPHTTSTRASRFEVSSNVRFLKAGAFDAQSMRPDKPKSLFANEPSLKSCSRSRGIGCLGGYLLLIVG
jgi:hypothetical protein